MIRPVSLAAALALILAPAFALGADYALTDKNTTITFIGSKPGGKHEGGFKSVTGTATVTGNDLTTLKATLDIDMNSLYTDVDKLTTHLKSPDFFGVKSNPKSKFVSTKVEKSGDDYKVTGDFTMLGKTKSITFPAKLAVTADGLTMSSAFTIDRTQWGMTYGAGKVDNDVKLTISIKAK
jgi:polyisoprenoid-binding protein YceI